MANAIFESAGWRRWSVRGQPLLFGAVEFNESEEYQAFRYKLLILLMVSGAVLTALFIAGNATEVNPITGLHRWSITLGTAAGLVLGNAHLDAPYSGNAMATAVLGLLYLGLVFHAYVDRSLSYFMRMRVYNRELQQLASRDPLTGVMNARAYYAACDQQIRLGQRNQRSFAVLFVDLDHFKRINDTLGHAAGDEVLRTVARVLQGGIRASDLLGRIGGEEFSIFLPETEVDGAVQLAEGLRTAVEVCRPRVGDTALTVTASIGVAASRDASATLQAIQEQADEAMYRAKQAGRNRVSVLAQPSA